MNQYWKVLAVPLATAAYVFLLANFKYFAPEYYAAVLALDEVKVALGGLVNAIAVYYAPANQPAPPA